MSANNIVENPVKVKICSVCKIKKTKESFYKRTEKDKRRDPYSDCKKCSSRRRRKTTKPRTILGRYSRYCKETQKYPVRFKWVGAIDKKPVGGEFILYAQTLSEAKNLAVEVLNHRVGGIYHILELEPVINGHS